MNKDIAEEETKPRKVDNESRVNKDLNGGQRSDESSILTKAEFDYLSNVVKPFIDRVDFIVKIDLYCGYSILISLKDEGSCSLPDFPKKSSMYTGMELEKYYTLEELGITYIK